MPEALVQAAEALHVHGEACYDEDGTAICAIGHVHTLECFENGVRTCEDEGYMPEALVQAAEALHVHTEDCFEMGEDGVSKLTCALRGGHVHTLECLDENGKLTCGFEDFFPEDAKLVSVEVNKTFTFGFTRFTVTGEMRLPKGMTQDDLFEMLFSAAYGAAAADADTMSADGLEEITDGAVPLSGTPEELDAQTMIAMLTAFADENGLLLTAEAMTSAELPHTGGVGLTAWYTAGFAMTAAAGLFLAKRKKENAA